MVKSMIVCFYTMLFMRKFTVYGELACFSDKNNRFFVIGW